MTANLQPQAHHPDGPSQWPMWSECIAFESPAEEIEDIEIADLDAIEGAPAAPVEEDEDNSPRARGTAMHRALAALFVQDPPTAAALLAELSEAEREQVQWCAAQIREIVARYGWPEESIRVERRVTLYAEDSFKVRIFGTLDAETEGGPLIFDAKFGDERNYFPQHAGYALAKMERDGLRRIYAFTIYGRRRRVASYVITYETARAVADGLLARRHAPQRRPTPCQYCGWCARRHECEALAAPVVVLTHARDDWPLALPQAHVSRIGSDPVLMGLALHLKRAYIEKWGSGVEFYARSLAERGIVPLGFDWRPRKGKDSLVSVIAAVNALERAGVPQDALDGAIGASMTSLTKAYADSFGIGESAARGRVRNILREAGLIRAGEPTHALVRRPNAEDVLRAALAHAEVPAIKPAQPGEASAETT